MSLQQRKLQLYRITISVVCSPRFGVGVLGITERTVPVITARVGVWHNSELEVVTLTWNPLA